MAAHFLDYTASIPDSMENPSSPHRSPFLASALAYVDTADVESVLVVGIDVTALFPAPPPSPLPNSQFLAGLDVARGPLYDFLLAQKGRTADEITLAYNGLEVNLSPLAPGDTTTTLWNLWSASSLALPVPSVVAVDTRPEPAKDTPVIGLLLKQPVAFDVTFWVRVRRLHSIVGP